MQTTLDEGILKPLREITDPKEVVRINDLKLNINEHTKKARYGRYVLFGLPVLYVIAGYFQQSDDTDDYLLLGAAIYGGFYLVSAALTYRWLVAGLVIGLLLYVSDHAASAVMDPATLLQGIFVKIAIVGTLGTAIHAAWQLRNDLNKLAEYPVPSEQIEQARKLQAIPRTQQVKRAEE
ncbi:hypothetical protein LEM8419_00464 [Neolewinella maritima]|uniref:DUF962 domain-containing protein n=1 Tax=Neolewinella maritima TaxID=1383882 RepID=A0ABM9AXJ6_9BACT|nr:hypothetical protein [Neolewinella maritima]CAH0999167.1 hypothetical protein LEM8419_00464 [Neolewinella maritima]